MRKSIRTKILLLFLSLLGIFVVCNVLIYRVSLTTINRLSEESVGKSMEQLNGSMNKVLTGAEDMAYLISQDADMQVALRSELPTEQQELYKERRNFNYALRYTGQLNENIQGIFVVGANGSIYRSAERTLYKQDFRNEFWYLYVMDTGKDYWVEPHGGSFVVHNLYDPVISLVVPIRDRISYDTLGVVVVDVAMEVITGFEKELSLFNGETFLTNRQNEIIYCRDFENIKSERNKQLSRVLAESEQQEDVVLQDVWVGDGHYLLYENSLGVADWNLVYLIPYDDVFGDVATVQNLMLVIIAVCSVLSVFYAISVSHWISVPIQKLKAGMQRVEKGDFSVRVSNSRDDELGDLTNGFNVMTSQIEQMTRKEQESQKMLLRAELNAMQAQINPHFLYNTLDSINWMVRMNRNEEVSEMIDALITLFLISLSKGRTFITVE